MPAVSQQQREFLNWKFGHKWVKKHHFANKGKLPHTHHEDEDEKEKEEENMEVARARLMKMVLEYEKSHGKKLSEEEERFLSEDISTVDIGPGPATRRIRRRDDEEEEDEQDPTFLARRKAALRRKVPNPAHDRLA